MGVIVDKMWGELAEFGKTSCCAIIHQDEYDALKRELLEYAADEGVQLNFKANRGKMYVYLVNRVEKAERDRNRRYQRQWAKLGINRFSHPY